MRTALSISSLTLALWLALASHTAAFDDAALFQAFTAVFPLRDGSEVLAQDTVFAGEARAHLDLLGVPHNVSGVCTMDESALLLVLMKASLGNLVQDEDPAAGDKIRQPYQANAVSGKLEYVDNFTSNRLVIFQVLVFSLLLGLARSWYQLERLRGKSRAGSAY